MCTSRRIAAFVGAALLIGAPGWTIADAARARTFASAAEASDALLQAVRSGDSHAIDAVLGSRDGLASCGDDARDGGERQRFVEKYQEMHRLVREPDGNTVLYVGAENWPFPIPLVSSRHGWHFDAEAGRREVMFRRIGADEATAIEVSRAALDAAKRDDTAGSSPDPLVNYARRLVSAAPPDDRPFHGYRFGVLKRNGTTIVAYPAEYRSSGVMTFMVGDDGVVYERDLGPDTARVVRKLKTPPASGWRVAG